MDLVELEELPVVVVDLVELDWLVVVVDRVEVAVVVDLVEPDWLAVVVVDLVELFSTSVRS